MKTGPPAGLLRLRGVVLGRESCGEVASFGAEPYTNFLDVAGLFLGVNRARRAVRLRAGGSPIGA